jgi:hypothetical protein
MQIPSEHYTLLFPRGYEEEAHRAAAILEVYRELVAADLGAGTGRYTVVLNTGRAEANGYVTLAPRYSEWYAYAPPRGFAGPVDWYTLLALHEGRHMAQFDYLDRGFNRFAGTLGGELGLLLFSSLSVPGWFWEGDAILAETLFSAGGRGRSADFHRRLRTIAAAEEPLSYQQAYLGSYRRRPLGPYHLGFPLVAYGRLAYGQQLWPRVLDATAGFSFLPLRFSSVLKGETGRAPPELYRTTLEYLAARWGSPPKVTPPGRIMAAPERPWRDYTHLHPAASPGGSTLALVHGRHTPVSLVRIDSDGKERPLRRLPPGTRHLDSAGGLVVWSEAFPHPIWSSRSSRDIVLYDLKEETRRRLTSGGAYFSPVLSPNGRRVAAAAMEPGGSSYIAVFDADSGTLLKKLRPPAHGSGLLAEPAWSHDGSRIAAVRRGSGRYSLLEFRLSGGTPRTVLPPQRALISAPVYTADRIVYVSDRAGREELYEVHPDSRERARLFPSAFGAGTPAWDPENDLLYYSDYTPHGYRAAAVSLTALSPRPLDEIPEDPIDYADLLSPASDSAGSKGPGELASAVTSLLESGELPAAKPYSPAAHALNVHSWGILPASDGRFEAFLLSRDVLRSLQLRTYLGFTADTLTIDSGFQGTLTGMFPLVHFGLSGDIEQLGDPALREYGLSGLAGLEFPFDFSGGLWRRELDLSSTLFLRASAREAAGEGLQGRQAPLRHRLSYYHASRAVTPLDFAPPWSLYLDASYIHSLELFTRLDSRLAGTAELTFPGLFSHQRLITRVSAEQVTGSNITLGFTPFRPRGYPYNWREAAPVNLLAAAEYSLPLFSPDWAAGELYYLKRVRGSLFYDHGLGLTAGAPEHYQSVGAELLLEQHLFSLPASVEFGIRGAYRFRDGVFRLEETLLGFGIEF